MNEDDEDYDELPPITVNSSSRDSSWFSMPCASEVASERARAERCERELVQLRTEVGGSGLGERGLGERGLGERGLGEHARSDSSGSEGEAALAAAVTELRVRAAERELAPRLADLLPAAPAFLAEYARAVRGGSEHRVRAATADLFRSLVALVQDAARPGAEPEPGLVLGAGLWLCLALVAREGRPLGPALPRAAHLLLDDAASDAEAAALAAALLRALPAPRARLELADAVRSGGPRADSLAAALVRAALADLMPADAAEAARRWRRLPARDRYTALQLAGRARAHGPAAGAPLLAALAAAPPVRARDHQPDALKVLVAASKLRVLFRVEK